MSAAHKWVVFDLGGVLFGWDMPLLRQHFPEFAAVRDPMRPLAERFFFQPEWKAFDSGQLSADEVGAALAKREGSPVEAMTRAVSVIQESLQPMADKVAFVRELAQRRDAGEPIRLAYLSNLPVPYARRFEALYDWFGCFDAGIFSGDVGCMKPDRSIYRLLAERTGAAPSQHLFIDDHLPNLQTAQGLGWATSHGEFERDYTIDVRTWLADPSV